MQQGSSSGGAEAQGKMRREIGRGLWASKQTPTTTQNLNLICQVFTN